MNAEQINAVGGWCELIGIGFLVRDLMSLAHYRGIWGRVASWLRTWRAAAVVWIRAGFRRPAHQRVRQIGVAADLSIAGSVSAKTTPGPFVPRREQTLREEIAELGLRVNQLQEEITREEQERERAIAAEREERREELRAEAERLERQIAEVRQDVERLRDATTGDLGLRAESVVFLALGIVFTTWSELFVGWLAEWPPFRVAMGFLGGYVFARISWAWWLRQRAA